MYNGLVYHASPAIVMLHPTVSSSYSANNTNTIVTRKLNMV